jgi:hypothetical protein
MTRPSTPPAELFTIETSHEAPRLTRPRLSALGSVETESERRRNHTERGTFARGNHAAEGRGAKTAPGREPQGCPTPGQGCPQERRSSRGQVLRRCPAALRGGQARPRLVADARPRALGPAPGPLRHHRS